MRRRTVLLGATAVTAAGGLPAPAIAQGIKELKMVTSLDHRDCSLGGADSADRLAQSITAMSDNRLKVTVYPANTLVRDFEVFDAVSAGAVDMYHSADNLFPARRRRHWICFADGPLRHDRRRAERSWITFRRRAGAV